MARIQKTATQAARRAKAAVVRAQKRGAALTSQLAGQPAVKRAKKTVARARRQASALARKAVDKVTGRAKARKRAKIVAAVAGAVVVAAAAAGAARRRTR